MTEIQFSHFRSSLALTSFEQEFHIPVRQRCFAIENGWAELLQFALHLEGPDVSEVGMSWLGSLRGMEVLRSFTSQDIRSIRNQGTFIEIAWQNCQHESDIVAIPWYLDTRLFCYRRDIFEKVGIDETTAFANPEQIKETLLRLKAGGFKVPWLVTTKDYVLQYLAPWVWWYGGSFRSRDGRVVTLVEPEAMKGLQEYLSLIRLLPSDAAGKTDQALYPAFLSGEVPVFYGGDWCYRDIVRSKPAWLAALGTAPIPGQPYVGAMYLINWRYSVYENPCMDLIRYLTRPETLQQLFEAECLLPPHLELLNAPPFTTDPAYQVIANSLKNGRTFNHTYRWAGVESRMNLVFSRLMADLIGNPELDLLNELNVRMNGLKTKLERTILA